MTYIGYIRVSTDKQDCNNQKASIENFAKNNGIVIDQWVEETISGTKSPDKRKLGQVLKQAKSGDTIICTELSRLGRSLFMCFDILNFAMTHEINVWTIKENYRLGTDISSAILAFAFSLSAQLERDMISARTQEALARKKEMGIRLGRPPGSKNKKCKLSGKEEAIRILLNEGHSVSKIAKLLSVDRSTLSRFIKSHMTEPEQQEQSESSTQTSQPVQIPQTVQ